MKREDETTFRWWTFGHTAPWIAVLQVIAALAQERFDKKQIENFHSIKKFKSTERHHFQKQFLGASLTPCWVSFCQICQDFC